MRRFGNLWPAVVEMNNLRLAVHKALKGKRGRSDARAFMGRLEDELARLRQCLIAREIGPGSYRQFVIRDPKVRTISAPSFRDRVLHHAIMNVMEPYLERLSIHHSYACRLGKGQFQALDVALRFSRQHNWYLQMDVRGFFASIPRDRLLDTVARKFKDSALLDALSQVVHGFNAGSETGLPLGSLISQHLANFYLGSMDRHITNHPSRRAYVRYMDDWILWSSDLNCLKAAEKSAREHAWEQLGLEMKPPTLNRTQQGIGFLGHRVFRDG